MPEMCNVIFAQFLILAKRLLGTLDGEIKEVQLEKVDFPVVNSA